MELYRLKSFLAILREGNLTRAAERQNLSQSALSSQLRQLEEELGVAPFRRTPRGMEATDQARELLPLVEGVLDATDLLEQRARRLSRVGGEPLTIGLNTDPGFLRVGALNRRLASLHDDLNVVFVASPSARTAGLLRHGQLDLAFFYGEAVDPLIRCRRLTEVRFCVVIPQGVCKGDSAPGWSEVAALPWVWVEQESPPYEAVRHDFERRGLIPSVAVQAVDEYTVNELVVARQGVAVMREDEARPLVEKGLAAIWQKGWQSLPLQLGWLVRQEENRRIRLARAAVEYLWEPAGQLLDDPLARISY